jgi:hypothetical protein
MRGSRLFPIVGPHFFEPVLGADFGPEQVHDDVAAVDQHPIALVGTLDADAFEAFAFQLFDDVLGHGLDVAARKAAGDDHVVGDRAFAGEVDDDRVGGFVVIERFGDEFKDRFGRGYGLALCRGDRVSPELVVRLTVRTWQ